MAHQPIASHDPSNYISQTHARESIQGDRSDRITWHLFQDYQYPKYVNIKTTICGMKGYKISISIFFQNLEIGHGHTFPLQTGVF